ncbi:sublancin family glycopeptide [Paenibacillus polymyxa]|uniref:sublancin family glycopeptide n=1 Tax=Paenibacillus amylolyticus TaxID=1451 RepID=UPI003242A7C7
MMKELMRELDLNELDLFEGGDNQAGAGVGGNSGSGNGIGAAQCAYFWTLCASTASERWGCGSTAANCEYFRKYC